MSPYRITDSMVMKAHISASQSKTLKIYRKKSNNNAVSSGPPTMRGYTKDLKLHCLSFM